jgi:3',5'-cyclic AMP phosphodiesterase CpdA
MPLELTSVSDAEVVFHEGAEVHRFDGLAPDTEHTLMGVEVRTLPRPSGELLCRFATVNDVHFGEEVCGIDETFGSEPVFRSEAGEPPYPEMMNSGAIAEITTIDAAAVIVKGDLTADGHDEEYASFRQFYGGAFGDRLHTVRGNHDGYRGQSYESGDRDIVLPGVRVLLLDTVIPFQTTGRITREQLAWADDLAASSDRPVIVMGHHHPWSPDSSKRSLTYFGINPDDSDGLVDLIARQPSIIGYFAGHTHRNRVRHFSATGAVPYVEVACVKDYPGTWAEYRVFEGGVMHVHRRISTPDALAWSEKTRAMFAGLYAEYAFGTLSDRCFVFGPRG